MIKGIAHLALAGLLLHGTTAIDIPSGFSRIVFEDDFSNQTPGSLPSTSKWTYSTGTSYPGGPARWGTNEIQTYTSSPQNVAITSSGTLRITPLNINGQWTSARLESAPQHDVACPEGGKLRIEASIKFGSAPAETQMGIWPSFWAMGAPFRGQYAQWPAVGEIDIAESVSGVSRVWNVLHCGWVPVSRWESPENGGLRPDLTDTRLRADPATSTMGKAGPASSPAASLARLPSRLTGATRRLAGAGRR